MQLAFVNTGPLVYLKTVAFVSKASAKQIETCFPRPRRAVRHTLNSHKLFAMMYVCLLCDFVSELVIPASELLGERMCGS